MTALTHGEFEVVAHGTQLLNFRRGLIESRVDTWWAFLVVGFLGVVLAGYAQTTPFLVRRGIRAMVDDLASAKDEQQLERIRNMMMLTRHVLRVLRPASLFKGMITTLVDELDEHLDSIDFALKNRSRLDAAMLQLDECA